MVCEAFNCTPLEAVEQDMVLVHEILDVRTLEAAKVQHNADASKMTEGQAQLWMESMEALSG